MILGSAGTGKTTLAAKLHTISDARLISLDSIWQPEWTEKDVPAFKELLAEAHRPETWISEGNFALATFDLRLPQATQIVWLEQPVITSLWRSTRRVLRRGEPHRIKGLLKVYKFIWNFDRINRPRILSVIDQLGAEGKVVHLHSKCEVDDFIARYTNALSLRQC